MPSRTPSPFRLALFWLGLQTVWGALLGISLQARSSQLAPGDALVAYGHLAATGATVAAVTQIAVGFWSDYLRRRGSRRIEFYVAGTLGGSVAIAAFYLAPSFTLLAVAYVALQLSLNLAIGPYQAILPDFIEPKRLGVASSWLAALQSIGNAIGAVFASLIVDARILAGAIDALLIGTCAATVAHVRRLAIREEPQYSPMRITRAFVDLFVSRALVYVGFFTMVGYLFFYVQGVLHFDALKEATKLTGLLILAFTIVGAAGAALAAKPSDRFDKRYVAMTGGAVMIVALVVFIASHAVVAAIVATCIAGIGWGVFLVADWALACRIMPAGSAASTMGVWNLALVLPQIAAPAFTTWMLTRVPIIVGPEAPREAFGLAVCEVLMGIAWLVRLPARPIGE
jgi:maltose/moltooligosaccharide transporter